MFDDLWKITRFFFFLLMNFGSWLHGPIFGTGLGLFRVRYPLGVSWVLLFSVLEAHASGWRSPETSVERIILPFPLQSHRILPAGSSPPWGGGGSLTHWHPVSFIVSPINTKRDVFSSHTFWGIILLFHLFFVWELAFVNQWQFCLRANSKKRANSACRFVGIRYKEGRLFWGQVVHSDFQ